MWRCLADVAALLGRELQLRQDLRERLRLGRILLAAFRAELADHPLRDRADQRGGERVRGHAAGEDPGDRVGGVGRLEAHDHKLVVGREFEKLDDELLVADIAGDEHVGVGAEDALKCRQRCDAGAGVVGDRLDVLDLARRGRRVLNRDEVAKQSVGGEQNQVERGGEPRARGRRHQDQPLLDRRQADELFGERRGHAQVGELLEDGGRRVDLHNELLARGLASDGEPAVPRLAIDLHHKRHGLRLLRTGRQSAERLDRRRDRLPHFEARLRSLDPGFLLSAALGRLADLRLLPDAVHLVPHTHAGGLEVDHERIGPGHHRTEHRLSRLLEAGELRGGFQAGRVLRRILAAGRGELDLGDQISVVEPGVNLDPERSEQAGNDPPAVADGEDLLRWGKCLVADHGVGDCRRQPRDDHQGDPAEGRRDPPGDDRGQEHRQAADHAPEGRLALVLRGVAGDPVDRPHPGEHAQPPGDRRDDGQAATTTAAVPARGQLLRPAGGDVGQRRHGCQRRHGGEDLPGERCRRGDAAAASSHHVTPIPLSAISRASRLGAISMASLRSMSC